MNDAETLMDRIRALVEGTLSAGEAESVRHEIESEPDGPELIEAYRLVQELTVPAMLESVETGVPVDVARILPPPVPMRARLRWAAVLLVALGAGIAIGVVLRSDPSGSGRVSFVAPGEAGGAIPIRSLAFDDPPVPVAPPSVPVALAEYRSVRDGAVVWLDDVAAARRIAELTSRPILWFIHHPSCPICVRFESGPLHDPDLLRRIEALVPVRIDVTRVPPNLAAAVEKRLAPRRWPYLAVEDAEGRMLAAVEAAQASVDVISGQIDTGLRAVPDLENRIDWERANRAARHLLGGVWAFESGRLGDADRAFHDARRDGVGPLVEAAQRGIEAVRSAAHVRFDVIRRAADADPSAAVAELAKAVADFHGTRYAEELEAVRRRLAATGRFPSLKPMKDD